MVRLAQGSSLTAQEGDTIAVVGAGGNVPHQEQGRHRKGSFEARGLQLSLGGMAKLRIQSSIVAICR